MISEQDQLELIRAESKAWRKISTYASLCECSDKIVASDAMYMLLKTINQQKFIISKLVDSFPDIGLFFVEGE
jgi:hypothetical protein